MNKKQQRELIKERLNNLTLGEQKLASFLVCENLLSLPSLTNAKVVFSYLATDLEIDLALINKWCLDHQKIVGYPYCEKEDMKCLQPLTDHFKTNEYGIKEPIVEKSVLIEKEMIDCILIPCVAYDLKGNRLGHGKGYYDKYLKDTKATKILVGFSVQQLEEVVTNEFDEKVDYIVNEKGIFKVTNL